MIISTLALAHIGDPHGAIQGWSRILRSGGSMLVTDFHSDAEAAGMRRTFVNDGEIIEIQHHAVAIADLKDWARSFGLEVSCLLEANIDDSVRPLFERDRAMKAFERHKGLKLVFGFHLVKS